MGISITLTPVGFTTLDKEDRETLGYYPSAYGLQLSNTALRERLGLTWYKHKYGVVEPAAETAAAPAR